MTTGSERKNEIEESFLKQIQLFHMDTGQDTDESAVLSSPSLSENRRKYEDHLRISRTGRVAGISLQSIFVFQRPGNAGKDQQKTGEK